MWIKSLKLYQFRNYNNVSIDFVNGVNYFQGNNGSGKTSIIEAVGLLPLCKSIRTNDEKDVIQFGKEFARIEAKIQRDNEESIKIVISNQGKMIENNDIEIKKISEIAGVVKTISFIPKDTDLFKDSPSKRRRFLDSNMSMLDKQYLNQLGEYNHYLEQIRAVLKKEKVDEVYLQVLVQELAKRGKVLSKRREKFVKLLNEELVKISEFLESKRTAMELSYIPDVQICEDEIYYQNILEKIKQTMVTTNRVVIKGIHQDDIMFKFNGKDLALYGSQGQNRISVIALKLSLFKLIKEKFHEEPIVLLDDVLSELDENHQKKLIKLLNRMEQVFITGTQNELKEKYALYSIEDNQVRRIK